ncbi:MAG: hypothetical protein JOS17DRAFT_778580 [Linnemannia elongata]|nr:MAG: hypothetical protein JOS17DRAFT_778580 [Linnemannia elongata]
MIQHLGHFLENDDLVRSTLTSRSVRAGLFPHGYRAVDARRPYTANGHIHDFEHISQHTRFVEWLIAKDSFIVATIQSNVAAFVNLTELILEMSDFGPTVTAIELNDVAAVYHRIPQSPFLETLRIRNVRYDDTRSARVLLRSLSSLTRLQVLGLESNPGTHTIVTFIGALFHCCPPSLTNLTFTCAGSDNDGIDLDWESAAFPDLPLVRRQQPMMHHLKDLMIYSPNTYHSPIVLRDIIVNSPGLDHFLLLGMYLLGAQESMTYAHPYASFYQQLDMVQGPPFEHANVLLDHISILPQGALRYLSIEGLWEQSHGQIAHGLQWHGQFLYSINFTEASRISSASLREILTSCPNLRVLQVANSSGHDHRIGITLGDAVAEPWICTRLKKLTIVVRMALDTSDSDYDFVNSLSDGERKKMFKEAMVRFSQQLGKLTELQELDIRRSIREASETSVIYLDEQEEAINAASGQDYPLRKPTGYQTGWLHGLLTFGDIDNGYHNTLSHLACLADLRVVKGTLQENDREYSQSMRLADAQWILTSWPSLETLELMYDTFMQDMNGNTFNLPAAFGYLIMAGDDEVKLVNKRGSVLIVV